MLQGVALPGFPDFMSPFRWGAMSGPDFSFQLFRVSAFQLFRPSPP